MSKTIATNKRAWFDYAIEEKFEAGVALSGAEIKQIRAGHLSLKASYARIIGSEAFLINANIANVDEPARTRKLLLHKSEITRLIGKTQEKRLTLVPLSAYFKRGKLKIELGLGRGKKLYDKREVMKKRDVERELQKKEL